jgi:Peptidase propeptide and YPEB domain
MTTRAAANLPLTPDQAVAVAQADATKIYRDLSGYAIRITLEDDGWHVDYELRQSTHKGGGPHYVIDAATGAIRSKRYEQ